MINLLFYIASIVLNLPGASCPRKRKKKDHLSINKLVNRKVCKIHSLSCECEQCYQTSNSLQVRNSSLNCLNFRTNNRV